MRRMNKVMRFMCMFCGCDQKFPYELSNNPTKRDATAAVFLDFA